jgi:hypothetical protein
LTTLLLLIAFVALLVVTALYARRRVTHPFTKAQVDAAREQSRHLSKTSRDGVSGENVAPWLPGFPYAPRDASFLGNPVDYVVFDGLDDGALREIVFVEIKTGRSGMKQRGQQIRRAIIEGRVSHQLVRLKIDDHSGLAVPSRPVTNATRVPTTPELEMASFDDRVQRAVEHAELLAIRVGRCVDDGDVVVALIEQPGSAAAQALAQLGATRELVEEALADTRPRA